MIDGRRFVPLLAAAAGFIVIQQAIDLSQVLPGIDLGTPAGRFRFLALGLSRNTAIFVVDVFLIWAAVVSRHLAAQRTLGWVHLVGGILLLVLIPVFLVEAGHIAGTISGAEFPVFRLLVARDLLLLLLLGAGGLLAGRTLRSPSLVPAAAAPARQA